MKPIAKLIVTMLLGVFFYSAGLATPPVISGRKWILERIRYPQTNKQTYVTEIHFLDFANGVVSFSIDCNTCSASYEFIAKDSINFYDHKGCTRKGCMEKDAVRISYLGKYKIWMEGSNFVIQTAQGDHIYK